MSARGNALPQDPRAPGLIRFRKEIAHVLKPGSRQLDHIAALRHWVRTQQSQDRRLWMFDPSADSGAVDPETLLREQRNRKPGACRRFGYLLQGTLLASGIPARLVSLQAFVHDGLGHIMVEAWVDELNKWILVDATTDTMFLVDGRYASLLELRRALLTGDSKRIRFERNGSDLEPRPQLAYLRQISRHAFFLVNETLFTQPPLTKRDLWDFRVLHFVAVTPRRIRSWPRRRQLSR